jgi:hypothetical protein
MPQEDEGTREMKHAEKVVEATFPAHSKASEVLEPRKEAFDLPSAAITA